MQVASVLAVALLVAGCATETARGLTAFNAGNNQEAYRIWRGCADAGDAACIHNIGVMIELGKVASSNRRGDAISWYTLSARYGFVASRVALARLNAPVPPPDLVREPTQAELDAAGAVGYAIGAAIGSRGR